MDGHECDGDDGCKHGGEHDEDEPGGAICCLRCGLGDAHGVDKGVRDELNELHVFPMVMVAERWDVSAIAESQGVGVHLLSDVGGACRRVGRRIHLKMSE